MQLSSSYRAFACVLSGLASGVLATVAAGPLWADNQDAAQFSKRASAAIAAHIARLPASMPKSSREERVLMNGSEPGPDFTAVLGKTVARIKVRDGAELYTEIYAPVRASGYLPIILVRSPYGLSPDKSGYSAWLRGYLHLITDGYIFAFQDTRGRGASTGTYAPAPPLHDPAIANATDDSTDTYDTIDWLIHNVPRNNGRVGMLGISYGGFLTTRALVNPHPALKAASPQASCVDLFIGDDFHHNGAFRLEYSFPWISHMERGARSDALLTRYDHYDRYLELGALANIDKLILHSQAPSWNAIIAHPDYDDFWKSAVCSVLPHIQSPVTVPTLNVGGWFDAEDLYGTVEAYKKFEQGDSRGLNHLVMGPWYHGGWSSSDGRTLGAIDFSSDTARWYREHIEAPWFAHWLKGAEPVDLPEVLSFRTGANTWQRYEAWPPATGIKMAQLYLQSRGGLSFEPPKSDSSDHDDYVSEPRKPVPYVPRPITLANWPEWEMADQRFVDGRTDVLTYETPPLTADLTITGEPIAHLYAATTGSDADWVVKLIDVYPDVTNPSDMGGFELMLAEEVFRARYRKSFEHPEAVPPGQIVRYDFSLRSRDHTFKAGHRVMVQIQSTWFPLIDRNPQTYVPNIYRAKDDDFKSARNSIYRSWVYPSHITLPVNSH